MTPVPNQYRKTFYYDGSKLSMPIARAFRSRGWQLVDDTENAHVIYTYSNHADWAQELQPWQRFNYIPGYKKWNKKDEFAYYYKVWEHEHPERPKSVYVPETYLLTESEQEIRAFQKVLNEGGSKYPWVHKQANVNQGKGITILAPESKQLLALPSLHLKLLHDKRDHSKDDDDDQVIIQRYVCNEMTWNKRKFDVRMYWLVASLDPLVVLYHDGYVRIGNSEYSEEDFRDTTSHLTTHTGLGAEGKATMKEFEAALEALYRRNTGHLQRRWPRRRDSGNMTPMEHVRNQFKHALGEMAEVFLTESFNKPDFKDITSENGFNFYCADYILDNDLDVFFIEPQNGWYVLGGGSVMNGPCRSRCSYNVFDSCLLPHSGLDEDYYFRLEMHASLFNGMVDVLEEISQKQEAGLPVLPLEKLGNWEIIYADGMVYHYEGYERSKNKAGCTTN
jgi:hypothetical protein